MMCLKKQIQDSHGFREYISCLAGELLFAAFTATTVNLTRPNLFLLSSSVHLSFSKAVLHFSLSLLSLFVFFALCRIMTVHHNGFISGNCYSHYLFNPSLSICQILICIVALQILNCLLFINRLATHSQGEIQLCLGSM